MQLQGTGESLLFLTGRRENEMQMEEHTLTHWHGSSAKECLCVCGVCVVCVCLPDGGTWH